MKIGGSLLSMKDAARRVRERIDRLASSQPIVVVVGGGEAVEWLRRVDRKNPSDSAAAHWAAVGMMDANAALVAGWLGQRSLLDDLSASSAALLGRTCIVVRCTEFLRKSEPSLVGDPLPHDWLTTSDSIAARVAQALGAELTLLKSAEPPTDCEADDWQALSEIGYVDASFPSAAGRVRSISIESL